MANNASPRGATAERMQTRSSGFDTAIGLSLAGLIIAVWLAIHIYFVFVFEWSIALLPVIAIVIAVQCWLCVGLFIVAHDAMHGSLAPSRPRLNDVMGQVCLLVYAGFSFRRLSPKHHAHHKAPGSLHDPDFDAEHPAQFGPWYIKFFATYFHAREFAVISLAVAAQVFVGGARLSNLLLFWALPAVASSVQLFYFGTYLPHRWPNSDFSDHHRARTIPMSWLMSLLTCFHFGYHHEHHQMPEVPWWRLPNAHAELERFARTRP